MFQLLKKDCRNLVSCDMSCKKDYFSWLSSFLRNNFSLDKFSTKSCFFPYSPKDLISNNSDISLIFTNTNSKPF